MAGKQSQSGGDDSTNIQAGTIIVHVGIDEKRAREICQEMSFQLRKEYAQEALEIAGTRVAQFEDQLMPKMQAVDGALEAFADPGFQLLLAEAQKTAAATERPADYDLLAELLIHRFQKGENRNMRAGISRAVEVVDEISDEALLGVTVAHAVSTFLPTSGDVVQGLDVLDDLYRKLIYAALPGGRDWLDHLDILDTARINSLGGLKKVRQFYPEVLSGYVAVGIERGSENFEKSVNLLTDCGLPVDLLVEHVFNKDYVRLPVRNKEAIASVPLRRSVVHGGVVVTQFLSLSEHQIASVNSIYDLYSQDAKLKNDNIELFVEAWNKRDNLRLFGEWWDLIPIGFQITSVGKVLAHSNA